MKKGMSILIFILFLVLMVLAACAPTNSPLDSLGSSDFSVKIRTNSSPWNGMKIETVDEEENKFSDKPALFDYILNSDYVVVAQVVKTRPVGRIEKRETNANIVNLDDLFAGTLYLFSVETILCSISDKLTENSQSNIFRSFQRFVPVGTLDETYQEKKKYLIFLQQVPNEENLSRIFELEKDQTYFRPYEGRISIFSNPGGFHSRSMKGIIDLSSTKDQILIKRIETFCKALSSEDINLKIENLKNLSESSDEELRENATYAINWLNSVKRTR